MIPDRYTTEHMAREHRQTLLREADQERMLAIADPPKHLLQSIAGTLGRYLLMLGTKLQQVDRRNDAVLSPGKSGSLTS
jgi:hypothetical protein